MSEQWVPARKAWETVWPGKKPVGGPNAIINRAALGVVKGKALLLVKCGSKGETREHNCDIPKMFWGGQAMIPNWDQGDFAARVEQNGQVEDWKAVGVTFEASGIAAMVPPRASANVSTHPEVVEVRTSRVGRSPNAVWERVMIELARRLYAGDLQPNRLGDVEKAIADFLSVEVVSMSESTIREHARLFWMMYEKEAGK